MFRLLKISSLALAAALFAAGCETVERARTAQAAVSSATNDVPGSVHARLEPGSVNLLGSTLVDYVAFAMTNRPSLEAARLAVSNAVLELARVTSDRALQLSLSGGYSQATRNGGSHFSWHQPRGRGTTDISADLLICDFGRLDARERQAREELVAAQRDLADEEFNVFNEVAQAYFTVLRNDGLLAVAHTNEFMFAEHLRQAESLLAAGEAKRLDVLKARVDLSEARMETITASNDVVTAEADFLRALGLGGTGVVRADVLEVAEDSLAPSSPRLPATDFPAGAGLGLARTNAPSLKVLRARLRAASAQVDYAVADLLPELTLSSAFSFTDPTWNWSWGFRAVQSVLDGFRKQTAVDQAVVALARARTDVEAAEQQLAYDLSVAAATRDRARQSLETARVEVEQARENYETVLAQYRLGDASRLDFTDAAGALAAALGARVKAFYGGECAEAQLIRLTGHVPFADLPRPTGTHREVNDHEMD